MKFLTEAEAKQLFVQKLAEKISESLVVTALTTEFSIFLSSSLVPTLTEIIEEEMENWTKPA